MESSTMEKVFVELPELLALNWVVVLVEEALVWRRECKSCDLGKREKRMFASCPGATGSGWRAALRGQSTAMMIAKPKAKEHQIEYAGQKHPCHR